MVFDHFTYKIKIKDNKILEGNNITFKSIIEIFENNKSIGNLKDNQGNDFILKKGNKIHCYIDEDNKFNVSILDNLYEFYQLFKDLKK